ncbi:hypothetical protein ACCO45_011106 [Purpureocillium lilacinum]|uniref:Uncharacterized protein n=1 Tax=Purpureocillium lilacinum TaxID=33203 RepID=A0ACC4DHG7_PURLI
MLGLLGVPLQADSGVLAGKYLQRMKYMASRRPNLYSVMLCAAPPGRISPSHAAFPPSTTPAPSSDPSIIGIFSAKKPQAVTIALSPTYRDGGNLGRRRRVKRRCRLLGLSATAQPLSGGGRPGRPYTRGGSGPEVGRGARPRKTRHGFQMGKSARRQSPLPRVLLRNPPWNRRASRRYLHGLAPGADAWCGHMVDCLDSPFAERPDQMVALPAIIAQWLKIQEVTDDCAASSQTPEPRVHQPFWRLPAWHCRLWA